MKDHQYALPPHLANKTPDDILDYMIIIFQKYVKVYNLCKLSLNVDTQYADDCGNYYWK